MTSQKSSGRPKKRKILLLRRVHGKSMLPTLKPGAIVVVTGVFNDLQKEDVVIILHGGIEKIKRIADYKGGRIYLTGDNRSQSTDSRSFGWLDESAVIGKVIWPRT
jgi:phage repressor protein C with HTH and peptisase S24 domain